MATAGGKNNSITILWRIENISHFEKGFHNSRVTSPIIKSEILGRSLLFLNLSNEKEDDIYLNFRISMPGIDFLRDCEFSLLTCDGTPLISGTVKSQCRNSIFMPDCLTIEEVFVTKKSSFLYRDTLTVRCRVWKSHGNFELSECISACSRINVSEDSFLLPVAGFDEFKEVQSSTPVVFTGFSSGSQILNCCCLLTGHSLPNSTLDIRITAGKIIEAFSMKLEVSALDDQQETLRLFDTEHTFLASQTKQMWTVPSDDINDALQVILYNLRSEDSLNILFHFKAVSKAISGFIDTTCGRPNVEHGNIRTVSTFSEMSCQTTRLIDDTLNNLQSGCNSLSCLVEDLRTLYCDQPMSDYKLRSGDVSFPVHKNILSARSPVFKTMFSIEMKESSSDSLDVPDVDSHTLNRMLTFLYTSSIEPDLAVESAAKLYYAADKYQVDSLKSRCSSILRSGTSVSNVSDVLSLAHKHEDQELTSFAHEFILSRFEEVMHSTKWESFLDSDPSLAGKTAHQLYKEKKARKKFGIATK